MPTKDELAKLNNAILASMCAKVAADPKNYTEEGAAKALELKNKWMALSRETPTSWKAKQSWELRLKAWKERAADFLAAIL